MDDFQLLLAYDDGAPVLPDGLPLASASDASPPRRIPDPKKTQKAGGDPNDLRRQGWAVIVPKGPRGDHLWDLCQRLRAARGGDAVRRYDAPPGLGREEAEQWRRDEYLPASSDADDPPRYLLILGDPSEVSWDLQLYLQHESFVGRLSFADDAGYERYIEKLLRAEQRRDVASTQARALFYAASDGSRPTTVGAEQLVAPICARSRRGLANGTFPAREVVSLKSNDELLAALKAPDPAVLFTLSHGAGPPRSGWTSGEEQREMQGAMVLDASGRKLTAKDAGGAPFLPDGVWFYFACCGAGTPSTSAYAPWMTKIAGTDLAVQRSLPQAGDPPFVGALPTAALASETGPLAVMAHLDLAWTYSFQDRGTTQPTPFQNVLERLVSGDRAGVAHAELMKGLYDAENALVGMMETDAERAAPPPEARILDRAALWMRRQDLANLLLLGDPAARLPIQIPDPNKAR